MSASGKPSKGELREMMRLESARHSEEERARYSERICRRIREQRIWQSSGSILFFWPIGTEPDLRPLCEEALHAGKNIAFPKFVSELGRYGAFKVTDPQNGLISGQFGIREPTVGAPAIDLKVLDLVFVPGISFSFDGMRLGRGKGYYDRLLSQVSGFKCGVAFDWQISPEIPREAHDIRLDCVVTPSQWRQFHAAVK